MPLMSVLVSIMGRSCARPAAAASGSHPDLSAGHDPDACGMLVPVTGVVVEREAELAALGEAIARGGVLVVAGPPGIGKSTLLRAAAAGAAQDETRVLVAAGTPLERGFAFGTARALLEAPVAALPADERAALLGGPPATRCPSSSPAPPRPGPATCTGRCTACTGSSRAWPRTGPSRSSSTTPSGPTRRRCASSPTSRRASRA